jgi:acyl carrier protein
MNDTQIYGQLNRVFRDVFDDETMEVSPQTTAKDVDGWDSLAHIRLILSVEKAFGIRFTTSEIGKLENVSDLAALIRTRA